MSDIDFFSSSGLYIFLPMKNNPKVVLCIDNSYLAQNAFNLYNPFSTKAKFLKSIYKVAFTIFNEISKSIIKPNYYQKSEFIYYLEKKLDCKLVSSIYFATVKDKVVLQLQTKDAQIIGYLKYPLNRLGLKHLYNEKKALEILSSNGIVDSYLMYDTFQDTPFLMLKPIEGHIGIVEKKIVKVLLEKFKRDRKYILAEHPRVKQLKKKLIDLRMNESFAILEKLCMNSSYSYSLVYEHGDFAPWNIAKVNDKYIPFDFEYFVEDGLEYFDLIKYYYQIGSLLKSKSKNELKNYVCTQIDMAEIEYIYDLYLIKEKILKRLEKI